jgi:hypothetical protein
MQICASAPVLRPLFAEIPFSLSQTLSRGILIKKSSGYASNSPTPDASRPTHGVASSSSSKRKLEAPSGVPELASDKGHSYEMKHWADVETGLMADDSERGSQEAILEDEAPRKKSITRLWDILRQSNSKEEIKEDMTITRTSEIELQIETASMRSSRRERRERYGYIHDARMPLPSMRGNQQIPPAAYRHPR